MYETTSTMAYWFNGTAYCLECVECDTPCMSAAERERSIREPGTGRCGCCGRSFEATCDCHPIATPDGIMHHADCASQN